ncbi:MAG: TIGR02300 family protein [Hyphomicrobiales bacterium]
MVKPELGTKRTCPSCASRFYDLLKNPIVCPKCGVTFIAATLLPSKSDMPAPAPAPKPREVEKDPEETADVELVSLEEVEEPGQDDETAAIEDVDLGEEADDGDAEDSDAFLEEEEEDGGDVSGLLDGGPSPTGKEDEEEV